MSTAELKEVLLNRISGLSEEALKEVIRYIQFLQYKDKIKQHGIDINDELNYLSKSEANHLEEEFSNYKKKFPHKSCNS